MRSIDPAHRKVIVTGANGGIGLAATIELARAGFDVVGTVRDDDRAAAVEMEARRRDVAVRTELLDVTDEDECRRLIKTEAPWGLVNNAGYATAGAIRDVSDDEARHELETLVLAPVRLSRLAAPGMRDAGGGRIVNVSSIAAEISSPLLGWYVASKNALEGISDAMRIEMRADGIDVVLVQPGMVRTGIWDGTRRQLTDDGEPSASARTWSELTTRLEPFMTSPEAVARSIREALIAGRPRDRYPVGIDAQILTRVARFVPVFLTDFATRTLLRLR